MRPNAISITLFLISCAIPLKFVMSQDGTEEADSGPWKGAEIHFMKHAEAVYIFSVKADSRQTPNQKELRRLGLEAQEALVTTLCNSDSWNWVDGGSDCEARDLGVLFQKGEDKLILRFCSAPERIIGYDVDGTHGDKRVGGWLKQRPWETWKQRFAQLETRK